jgi:hypothetical protein
MFYLILYYIRKEVWLKLAGQILTRIDVTQC